VLKARDSTGDIFRLILSRINDDDTLNFGNSNDINIFYEPIDGVLQVDRGTGTPDFEVNMPLKCSPSGLDEYSQFGANPVSLTVNDATDKLVVTKQTNGTGTGLNRRGMLVLNELVGGSGTITKRFMALNVFANMDSSSTADLTQAVQGGGLTGGRYLAQHSGAATSTVTLGGGISGLASVGASGAVMTDGYGFQAEGNLVAGGTLTNSYGFWARQMSSVSGTLTNNYGFYAEEHTRGTNNYEYWADGAGGYWCRDSLIFMNSDADTFMDLHADGGVRTPDCPFHLKSYTTGGLPSAGTAGRIVFDSTIGTPHYDDGSNWKDLLIASYPACYTESTSTNITTTAATVGLDTETLDPDAGHSISSSQITVTNGGYYHISYSIPVNDDGLTGNPRCRIFAWVEINTGGGFTAITQSRSQDYAREGSQGQGVSAAFIANVAASALLQLRIQASDTTDLSTESGEAQLSLHRVREL
jgi:hypothetical protein